MSNPTARRYTIEDLTYLMQRLRDPQTGCPWDLQQSFASIVPSTLEEAYEVADAIETGDFEHLREELGDLLFQVIFYSQLGSEEQRFDFAEVVSGLVAKLVRRHPHVFPLGTLESEVQPGTTAHDSAIKARWESLKQEERVAKGKRATLDDIPVSLAALTRAQKLQKRAAGVGFDWPDVGGALAKVDEEILEVREALAANDRAGLEEELGDLLFAVVNVSRHLQIDAEQALRAASRKFEGRFRQIETGLSERQLTPQTATLAQMDALWDEIKQRQKAAG